MRVEGQVQHHREGHPGHLVGGQLSSLLPPWLLPLFGSHSTAVAGCGWWLCCRGGVEQQVQDMVSGNADYCSW